MSVQEGPEQAAHHLRSRVHAGVSIGLAVEDEGVPARAIEGHAALHSILLPGDGAPHAVFPVSPRGWVGQRSWIDAADRDGAVTPDCGGSPRGKQEPDGGGSDEPWQRGYQGRTRFGLPKPEQTGKQAQHHEHPGDELPAARCGQKRDEAEPTCQGSSDGPQGVGCIDQPSLASHLGAAASEQSNEQGELNARSNRRG